MQRGIQIAPPPDAQIEAKDDFTRMCTLCSACILGVKEHGESLLLFSSDRIQK